MEKRKYYAVLVRLTYETTVLVPVDTASDMDSAISTVEECVEADSVDLTGDGDCDIIQSPYAGASGIYELSDEEASLYPIVEGDEDEEEEEF